MGESRFDDAATAATTDDAGSSVSWIFFCVISHQVTSACFPSVLDKQVKLSVKSNSSHVIISILTLRGLANANENFANCFNSSLDNVDRFPIPSQLSIVLKFRFEYKL